MALCFIFSFFVIRIQQQGKEQQEKEGEKYEKRIVKSIDKTKGLIQVQT